MNAPTASAERQTETIEGSHNSRNSGTKGSLGNGSKSTDCVRLNSRARRKLLRRHGLRHTIIGTCSIMPLTESEAAEHRQRVKTQFFAQLEEWRQAPPGIVHFLLRGWKFPVVILAIGLIAGFLFDEMFGWVGLALVFGFGGWLREAITEAANTQRGRYQSAQRIKEHARWKVEQDWTSKEYKMFFLLESYQAPALLQSAVLKIQAAHPTAEFLLEVFDEDPILHVRKHEPGIPPEQYVLGAWGLPEKFTFY